MHEEINSVAVFKEGGKMTGATSKRFASFLRRLRLHEYTPVVPDRRRNKKKENIHVTIIEYHSTGRISARHPTGLGDISSALCGKRVLWDHQPGGEYWLLR